MPISAQQWRLAVGQSNASHSLRLHVTGKPKMKLTIWNVLLFIFTVLLGAILLSEDGGRETGQRKCVSGGSVGRIVGELVPSLLTAPWRKELLMLAGDVERNPGPFTQYGRLKESDLDKLVEEMSGVSEKWESIGQNIFYSEDRKYLTDICTSYSTSHDCLREMLITWFRISYYFHNWGPIILGLRKAGQVQLADHLKAKYIADMLEESGLDLLTQELTPAQNKWENIGRKLDPYALFRADEIRCHYPDGGDCLRAMLKEQMQFTITWRNIVDALRSPDIQESQLADQLEAKYCLNLLGVSHLSLIVQELNAVCEKWQYIGEELGVGHLLSDIRIKYSKSDDCLRKVLRERLQLCATTWKHIVAVLRTPGIGESHLADHLEARYCSTAQQILQEALEKGYVDCHIWKVLVTGTAGSGKTTLKHRLFGEEPPCLRCSTALAEAAIRAISREIVGTDQTGWFRVSYEELTEMLGGALRAGVPMEKSTPKVTGVVVPLGEQPTNDFTTHDSKQPKVASAPVGSSPKPSTEATASSSLLPTTSAKGQVSLMKKQLVQLVERSQGSKRFLELHWIHFIDSGGQPQFHEVLPAFIRNTTATIFVMKLSERLDEHPVIKYFDGNGELCGKPYRHALSNHQMLQCCIRTILSRPATKEGKHSRMFVVGTHRDLESFHSESRMQKNKMLVSMLKPLKDQLVYYRLGSEIIFPINAKRPTEQDQQVCAMIRKVVDDKKSAPPHYKIPVGWFLLEQDIIKASKGGIISKTACLSIASLLNINAEALTAALKYFDDLNIFLYYPSILPELVFSSPQIPLDKVTELVHFSYSLHSDNPPIALDGKWLQFRDKGIVTVDMFQDERFSTHYIPELFTQEDLIKLFKHLLIIAPLSSTEYFMPSLLQTISSEEVSKQLSPSSSVAPLLVHFPAGCAQNGVFCALVVYLLSKSQWKVACDIEDTPLCVSRSCINFRLSDKPVCIVLVDKFAYFEVHVTTRSALYPKVCPIIQQTVFRGLNAAAESLRYNNSTPVPAFFCKCSSPPHAATPVIEDDDSYLMCTKSANSGLLTKQHTVWLDVKLTTAECVDSIALTAERLDLDHPRLRKGGKVMDKLQKCHTEKVPRSEKPNFLKILSFPGENKNINIPKQISTKYFMFGILLLNDETGAEVRTIITKHHEDAEQINLEILSLWIEGKGKPLSWDVLIDVLKAIGLSSLAKDIDSGLS